MPVPPQLARFGVFELDLNASELRKNGRKLKLQDQPFRLLSLLLEQPGQAVTRDRLKEALWPADTFVDFDHSLNAAIAKLRQSLGDSAENPRFVETVARKGYRFIAPVEFAGNSNGHVLEAPRPPEENAVSEAAPASRTGKNLRAGVWIGIGLAFATLAFLSWDKGRLGETKLVKLTDDTGLTTDPAISPDGKLLSYASDRGSAGNLNVWIQQLGPGGSAVQLTHEDVDTDEPAFSPDSTRIAFRSKKDGGGIYVMPVIGGEPSRIAPFGRSPRFSPDGRWIAYWSGGVYVISASGGEPRRLGLDIGNAQNPAWSPDGKHLLAYVPPKTGYVWDEADWWLLGLDGGASQKTGDFGAMKRQGFSFGFDRIPRLSQWNNGFVTFTAAFGDSVNSWRVPVAGDGRIDGHAERLTSGTTTEISPAVGPNGELIFASVNPSSAVWSVAADPDGAKILGDFKRITAGAADLMPSVSADGRTLAFTSARRRLKIGADDGIAPPTEAAELQMHVRNLSTGKEKSFAIGSAAQWHPQISHDGSMVAFTSGKPGRIYAGPVERGPLKTVTGDGNFFVWDWSRDNKRLLLNGRDQQLSLLDLLSGSEKPFLSRTGFMLFQVKFSPDEQSVAVLGCHADDLARIQCQIFVVPIEHGVVVTQDRWIPIDHPSQWDDKPRWSPSGELLYFISDRDGYFCLWAQRINVQNKRTVGAPFPVYHFHNARLSASNLDTGYLEFDVAKDKIVIGLGELTGNIWSLNRTR
jgi:Tol biopolymer transport system component/DNA-binding winged helix-turn-helix (wHTH) protein